MVKDKRVGNKLIVFGFVLALILPLLHTNLVPGKISEAENRVLASFPNIIDENGDLAKDFFAQFKTWFNDNVGFRSEFVTLNGMLQYHVFNKSPTQSVEIGRDGWMYYTLDHNMDIARGTYPDFDEDILEITCERQIRIQEKLAEKGIDYGLILPSSKVSIYPEYIASGDYQIRETPCDSLADYMDKHSSVNVIKLKDILLEEKENQQIYFKTDTHWNDWGAYTAYKEIITQITRMGLSESPIAEVFVSEGTYKGEFAAMMGNQNILSEEPCPETSVIEPAARNVSTSDLAIQIKTYLESSGIYTPMYLYENSEQSDKPSVLLFGDSLFASWTMPELFAESFSQFCYVWSYDVDETLIDMFQPDIVLCTIGERYLNLLYTKSALFTSEPIENADADILSYKLKGANIEVEVQNVGEGTWTAYDNVRLGVFKNGEDTGYRIDLPFEKKISTGDSVWFRDDSFPFDDFAIGDYQFQMLQEGIQYFGERYPGLQLDAEVIAHTAPEAVNHQDPYTINITVKNTGESAWSETDQIRLCIWQDGTDWGYRLYLPDGVTVNPGEKYTFTLEGFVLPEADQTTLEFQMLQEGVRYFGEKESAFITADDSVELQ